MVPNNFSDNLKSYKNAKDEIKKKEDFVNFKSEFVQFIEVLQASGVNLKDIFIKQMGYNQNLFDDLLVVVNNYPDLFKICERSVGFDVFKLLYEEMRNYALENGLLFKTRVNPKRGSLTEDEAASENFVGVALILHMFYESGYLYYDNGKIKKKDVKVDHKNLKAVANIKNTNKNGFIEGIIDRKGQFYMSNEEHEILINYLLADGVDVKGALRLNQNALTGEDDLTVSSLYHFKGWFEDLEDDLFLKVTSSQAETLCELLDVVKMGKLTKVNNSLENVLRKSSNLGFSLIQYNYTNSPEFDLKTARWNFLTFEEVTGGLINAKEWQQKVLDMYRIKVELGGEGEELK